MRGTEKGRCSLRNEEENVVDTLLRPATFFVSPGYPFFKNPSMVFRRRVRVWTLSFTTRNDTHAPISHHFLGRIFCLPRWSLTLSRGEMIETFYENSHCTACIFLGGLVTIFVSASGPTTPCDVTYRPSFDVI